MKWVLITGGVYSGIGKGCLAAILARFIQKNSSFRASYKKLEPCLQGVLQDIPNTVFGEIVKNEKGLLYDGDVARAAFYIPDFEPDLHTHLSLGQGLERALGLAFAQTNDSPRLDKLGVAYAELFESQNIDNQVFVVEVGGTAGEPEHGLVCKYLLQKIGAPCLHLHLTAVLLTLDQRLTTKPAQISLDALQIPPDVVLVRSPKGSLPSLEPLRAQLIRGTLVAQLAESAWAEPVYWEVLNQPPILERLGRIFGFKEVVNAPILPNFQPAPVRTIGILTDAAGLGGYQSLCARIWAWSGGKLAPEVCPIPSEIQAKNYLGLIRIGETAPPALPRCGLPCLEIVPCERGAACRDISERPDWQGRADKPEGMLFLFLNQLLATL